METRNLMNHENPWEHHPTSRDWYIEPVPCEAMDCLCNTNNMCIVPSRLKIGADQKCTGYLKDPNK